MTLTINGERKEFEEAELPLPELLNQLGFGERPVLVELNGTALRQREHEETTIQDSDRLEIILIVAGG